MKHLALVPYKYLVLAFLLAAGVTLSGYPLTALQSEDEATWADVDVPADWKRPRTGAGENGFRWYRCQIAIPADWKSQNLTLLVEPVDDAREIFFNGVRIGTIGAMPPKFRSGLGEDTEHKIQAAQVLAGQSNVLAIRVYRKHPRGGFNVAAPVITNGKQAISTNGKWQTITGDDQGWALWKDAKPESNLFSKVGDARTVIAEFRKLENDRGARSPSDALKQFTTTPLLSVDTVLSDPDIAQPLSIKFDERGRMWVMEYRQYPDPAGVEVVSRDKYLRTVYDKLPLPPPLGARGQDRISIHEDTNGDGKFDNHKVFVDGLNIATSFAIGDGGVYVLNPPYLLFYRDRNQDDQADGDPVVILEGFGIEDTHSAASHLRWGPDGWLYGAQGSTVSGNIKHYGTEEKPISSMGQGIWRYHPGLKKYEMFAEGGGNTYGVEFDSFGRVYSGYNGGNTRGFHYVQGGYYLKGFSKHGQLSNPYAFGYFPAMAHTQVPRFTHTFVIYEDPILPEYYRNRLYGVEPLQGRVVYSSFEPDTSTFKTTDLGHPLKTTDTWFRPVDIQVGPDGALYVADLYEQRIDHASHFQGRIDNTNGRVYRLRPTENWKNQSFDCSEFTNQELFGLFSSPFRSQRQTALRLLRNRKLSKSDVAQLQTLLTNDEILVAINALWALNVTGNFDLEIAQRSLTSEHWAVRGWSIRLAADHLELDANYQKALLLQVQQEGNVQVRSQMAASARRVSPPLFAGMVKELLQRDDDVLDRHIPLLIWWAIEANATEFESIRQLFGDPKVWTQNMTKSVILQRLVKRYAMSGTRGELENLAWMFQAAPDKASRDVLMAGFEQSFEGRSLANLPASLLEQIRAAGGGSLKLKARLGDPAAIATAIETVTNPSASAQQRQDLISVLGQINAAAAIEPLLGILGSTADKSIKQATLNALQGFDTDNISANTLAAYVKFSPETQVVAQSLLASRADWTVQLLQQIQEKKIPVDSIRQEAILTMLLHDNEEIKSQVVELFGELSPATSEQLQTRIKELISVIAEASGNPYDGKRLFLQHCGKCHQLFTDGGKIGPNLTTYKRDDLQAMLLNVVNPSITIREGFENYALFTLDGRTLTGFIDDQDSRVVVLRGTDGQRTVVNRNNIDEMQVIQRSLMPEGILKTLTPQQIRDLFAYLRASQPLP
ncbi:MAG: c-type cytochrome [Planctomycetaceae bacterium]|nr:c-type cytochrome [Planctomycetaceae bacterium]MBT4723875.1 c-type cytochrome [Planctomycetaceae bacterium]MBT5599238.1 c-type cytochrome [Planctomycetaceae bacterium]MBT5882627.1 c-type cytochrome [Planctomycetaceae bacterium]MBT7256497.1 c-type cytochrome [Planctomycetaceae bacterium]